MNGGDTCLHVIENERDIMRHNILNSEEMTSPDQNEPTTMETYLEAVQHNRGSEGTQTSQKFDFAVEFTPTFGFVPDVESAECVRREYEQITRTKFSTYRQSKDFGKEDIRTEHHKICWEDTCKLTQGRISFDHLPYIVIGIKMLDCQFGRDRHRAKKMRLRESSNNQSLNGEEETKRRKQIAGKKKDCPAQIYYRDILKFPDFAISANTVWRRKAMSEKLRKSFGKEEVTGERRIYIKFPEREDHKGHAVHEHKLEIGMGGNGSLVLAASGLTGKSWMGSLWFFEDPANAPDTERCSAGVKTEAGITDMEWIDENRLAIGSDTGAIEVWQLENGRSSFRNLFYLYEHDSAVNSVSVNSNKTRVVSGSTDNLIKLWDLAGQRSISTLKAHTAKVEQVACSPNELEVFISCSQDGLVFLWDMRKPKPARKLPRPPGVSLPTSLAWKPGESHVIAIGDESGTIVVQDARSDHNAALVTSAHTRAVHRLAFSAKTPLWLASVSDDCTAAVTELQPELKQIYRSYGHNDFVHGVSWDTLSNKLLTCGWDGKVVTHDINLATSMSP